MNNLFEILQAVRAGGQRDKDILAFFLPSTSLSYQFVKGLCVLKWKNDEEAMNELYPGTSKANNGKYRQLKSSVRQKLLNILLYTAPDGAVKSSIEAKAKIMKLLSAGYILLSRNASNSAVEVLLQAEMLSIDYEFTTHAFMAASPLESYYAVRGDNKSAEEYRKRKESYLGDIQARSRSQQLYTLFASITNSTSNYTKGIIEEVEEVATKLTELAELHPIYDVIMPAKRAGVYTAMMKRDYNTALVLCKSILQYFDEHPLLFNPTGYYTTLSNIATCHKELFHYMEALEYNTKAIEQTQAHTSSWALHIVADIEIALRAGDLERAYNGLLKILEFKSLGSMREMLNEQAVLLHGFFVIAVKSCYYEVAPKQEWLQLANRFDLDELINQSPVIYKDKMGYNTSRVLLQVLLYVALGQYNSAISRETALIQYRNKYIDKHSHPRTYTFFKLMLLSIEHKYDVSVISKKSQSIVQRLEPTLPNAFGVSEGFEPIEYRTLWKMVVLLIESHTHINTQDIQ